MRRALEEQARRIVAQIVINCRGEAHLEAKPCHPTDGRPDPSGESGDGGSGDKGSEVGSTTEEKAVVGGTYGYRAAEPLPEEGRIAKRQKRVDTRRRQKSRG